MERLAIGLDIGGTKTAIGVVDSAGTILGSLSIPTNSQAGFAEGQQRLGTGIRQAIAKANVPPDRISGIGIGCAGPLDPVAGIIRNPFTLPGWEDAPIVAAMAQAFGLRTLLENDVDAALTGECLFGAAQGRDPSVMLTFGTGVGGAVLIGGKILRGVGGAHPEPGHMQVLPDGPECYCGNRGCLESIASGTALAESGLRAGFADAPSLFAAARLGDAKAGAILRRAAQAIESAVWNLAHAYAPQVIVLGGGIMEEHFDLLTAGLKPLWHRATQIPCPSISIVKAALGNRAGLVGAAGLVFLSEPATAQGRP